MLVRRWEGTLRGDDLHGIRQVVHAADGDVTVREVRPQDLVGVVVAARSDSVEHIGTHGNGARVHVCYLSMFVTGMGRVGSGNLRGRQGRGSTAMTCPRRVQGDKLTQGVAPQS